MMINSQIMMIIDPICFYTRQCKVIKLASSPLNPFEFTSLDVSGESTRE